MFTQISAFRPEQYFTAADILEFILRVVLASLLGIVVGLERSKRSKEAGIRTHCIVAMAAAVFMLLSKYAFLDLNVEGTLGVKGADPSRIASQVVSGVSFLGAGIIFKHGHSSISGLTTAAGMWATSAIGMCIGAGMYWMGLTATVLVLLIQLLFHNSTMYSFQAEQMVHIRMKDDPAASRAFHKLLKEHGCEVSNSSVRQENGMLELDLTVHAGTPIEHREVLEFINDHKGVCSFRVET